MGLAYANVRLSNPAIPGKEIAVSALADTGAVTLCVPESVARELELDLSGELREVTIADGARVAVPYVGPIELWFEGRHCFVGALVIGDEVLLGAIPMEDMDLVVTPSRQEVSVNPDSPDIASLKVK